MYVCGDTKTKRNFKQDELRCGRIVDANELQKTRRAEKLDKIEGNWNGNR